MSILKGLQPSEVFYFFEQLSNIPRGSQNEKQASDYVANFAKERNLEYHQDELSNILVKKPGTAGYENAPSVILHGHLDMVCKKNEGVEHDFLKDGIKLKIDGDFIKADGTTLGADNGIGISYFLALLDSKDIPHPPIEMALTIMEEMGKVGGDNFNTALLSGKRMIDLNWHKDDHLLAGCAGDVSAKFDIPVEWEAVENDLTPMAIKIGGLKGGHCEFDIVLERGNSIVILGRLLNNILEKINIKVASISGGVQNNVIPAEGEAVVMLKASEIEAVKEIIDKTYEELKREFRISDPDLEITFVNLDKKIDKVFSDKTAKIAAKSILLTPNGVQSMSLEIEGISECSNNIGLMVTENDQITIISTITSGITSKKREVLKKILSLAEIIGNGVSASKYGTDAPEWTYNENSKLLEVSKKCYKELFGEEASIEVMPASLELGLFGTKIPGLDIISIGTETFGVHTPEEKLNYKSVARVWKLFKEVMKNLNK